MFRSAIEEGITLLLKQIGKEKEIYNDKMEIGLDRKINLICGYMPTFKNTKLELKDIKWFGDKSVHEANMPINENDILNNLEPKTKIISAIICYETKRGDDGYFHISGKIIKNLQTNNYLDPQTEEELKKVLSLT